MKVKELKKTVNVCWSPEDVYPVYLAAGAAAQQVDASFSSSAQLEIYSLNLEDPGLDLELKSSLETQHKFQKIVWSGAGIIAGGCDNGLLEFYNADKLLSGASDALVGHSTKHSGNVSALDVNPYQKNLLASGASDSEIFIWDLNNTAQPMAPGNRSTPLDHVQGLAWNHQVQHILGSTFATRCVVWDLRKNEPIMKLRNVRSVKPTSPATLIGSDAQSRTRWRAVQWHPAVATQLCVASDDDQAPVLQIWDLRLAASPLVTLEGHRAGALALSWSSADSDLLLSAGKDGRVLAWNPNNTKPGGELLGEVCQQGQWVFDVAWCPRSPALLAAASFDRHVAVHSLLAGSRPEGSAHAQSNIMESFGAASFSQLPAVQRATAAALPQCAPQFPHAPTWLRRPVAAKFAFGGKLVTFEKCPQEAGPQKLVHISQVVSEPEIVERATELDALLGSTLSQDPGAAERLAEYCRQKGEEAMDQNERYTWFFLRANFLPNFRSEVLNLLGYKTDEIPAKFKPNAVATGDVTQPDVTLSRGESTETEAELSTDTSTDLSDAHTLIERKLANVDLGPSVTNVVIPNGEGQTSLICRALVCGNLEEAVELCLDAKRIADALIIASLGSQELLYKVQKFHLKQAASDPVALVAGSLLGSSWALLVGSAAAPSWRATLAALLTHADDDALAVHCEMLGDKLSQEGDPALASAATLCYVCSASPDALVGGEGSADGSEGSDLAGLTERALLARRAAQLRGRRLQSAGKLERVLAEYAARLAGQGCLASALRLLDGLQGHPLADRLQRALGRAHSHQKSSAPGGPRSRTLSSQGLRGQHQDMATGYGAAPAYEQSPWQSSSVPLPHSFSPYGAPSAPQPQQPPQQPPRPGSVGPGSGGITSRSKYKVDPSVQSAPLYNQYSFNNPAPSQYGYNSPLPDQYGTSSVPAPNTVNQYNPSVNPLNPAVNPMNPAVNPLNPAVNQLNPAVNQLNPAVNQLNPAVNHLNPAVNQLNPAVNPLNPAVNGTYNYNPAPPVEPAVAAMPSKPVPPGWNDPPMPSSKNKPKQEMQAQAPITHPLFGVEPPQHVPLNPTQYPGQYPDQQYQQQQYPGQQYPQQQYQQQYTGQYGGVPQAYPQQVEGPAAQAESPPAERPLPKPPLPEQHAVLQTVFDSLRNDCAAQAHNQQMKRKLEDVQRRLETLYDMLRENRLSESALGALHACAQAASGGAFQGALEAAAALAEGADFAAAASFLPALKQLMQMAMQLRLR